MASVLETSLSRHLEITSLLYATHLSFALLVISTEMLFFFCLSTASSLPLTSKAEPSIIKVTVEVTLGYGRCVLGKWKEGSHFQRLCSTLMNS